MHVELTVRGTVAPLTFGSNFTSNSPPPSSQKYTVTDRGDAFRVVARLISTWDVGGHVVAMLDVHMGDLWLVLMFFLISREPPSLFAYARSIERFA